MSEKTTQAPEAPKSNKISSEDIGCPYAGTFTLKDTAKMMFDPDHKVRFIAEYIQLKVRYEKLKHLLNKWDAFSERFDSAAPKYHIDDCLTDFVEWMGFLPSCSKDILQEQQHQMGELLHTLEVRAIIEGIDLRLVTIKL